MPPRRESASSWRTEPIGRGASSLRFAVGFLGLVLGFAMLSSTDVAQHWLHEPLTRLIASWTAAALAPFGAVDRIGTTVGFEGFRVQVVEACDGIQPTYIYLAAVLAFPSSWSARLWGVLIGVPAIFVVNLLRVISLVVLGAYWPEIFERVHIYVWQTLVILLAMGVWLFWAETFAAAPAEPAPE